MCWKAAQTATTMAAPTPQEASLGAHTDSCGERASTDTCVYSDDEADTQLLSNPLALLAHSSSESTSAASRSSTLQRSLIPDLTRGETNRAEEPVQAGLLTAADFKRLISLYGSRPPRCVGR